MTAILVLAGIVVAVIAAIVLVTVPVRHVEAVAREFPWRRRVRMGTRVWVRKRSNVRPSGDVRNVQTHHTGDIDQRYYTYEERVWRKVRSVEASGLSQANVRWPQWVLGKDEEVRDKREWYRATFAAEGGKRYTAKVSFAQWTSLQPGVKYRLGRNTFGGVRSVMPARVAVNRRRPDDEKPET